MRDLPVTSMPTVHQHHLRAHALQLAGIPNREKVTRILETIVNQGKAPSKQCGNDDV